MFEYLSVPMFYLAEERNSKRDFGNNGKSHCDLVWDKTLYLGDHVL